MTNYYGKDKHLKKSMIVQRFFSKVKKPVNVCMYVYINPINFKHRLTVMNSPEVGKLT